MQSLGSNFGDRHVLKHHLLAITKYTAVLVVCATLASSDINVLDNNVARHTAHPWQH